MFVCSVSSNSPYFDMWNPRLYPGVTQEEVLKKVVKDIVELLENCEDLSYIDSEEKFTMFKGLLSTQDIEVGMVESCLSSFDLGFSIIEV